MLVTTLVFGNQPETWIGHWLKATQYAKDCEFIKSIDEYTMAIDSLPKQNSSHNLHLYLERGNIFFTMQDFERALKDFTFVLQHKEASNDERADALWGHSRVNLAMGNFKNFEIDVKNLEEIEPIFIVNYEECQDYVVFQMAPRFRRDKNMENIFIKTLMTTNSIDSEKDVVFTSSGIGIIKKSKALKTPLGPALIDKG